MILRTTSKLVCYSGRSGKSYAVAALADATASKSETESSKASDSNGVSASEAPKIKSKKVSRAERRAMVADFVHKYKAMNDGKLPCTSIVVKQVGGSYYVTKNILQELQSQLKPSSANNANQNTTGKERINQDGRVSDEKAILTCTIPVNTGIENDMKMLVTNRVDINDASEKHTEAESGSQYSSSIEKSSSKEDCYSESAEQSSILRRDAENVLQSSLGKLDMMEAKDAVPDFIETPSSLLREEFDNASRPCRVDSENGGLKEALANGDNLVSITEENTSHIVDTKRVSHPGRENMEDNKHKEAVLEELRSKDGSTDKPENDEGTPRDKPAGDTSRSQASESELSKKSTLWGTLRSFADGIINIWRKS